MNPKMPFRVLNWSRSSCPAHRLISGEQGFLDAALATSDRNVHERETKSRRARQRCWETDILRTRGGLRCGARLTAANTPPADNPHAAVARNSRNVAKKCQEFLMGIWSSSQLERKSFLWGTICACPVSCVCWSVPMGLIAEIALTRVTSNLFIQTKDILTLQNTQN